MSGSTVRPVLEDITVVIPTLGRPILEQSLAHIASGSAWPGCLIVIDQSKNADAAVWIEQLQAIGVNARHISSDQHGRAAGLNRGLERLQTPFVAITDDDCFVDPNWLSRMADCLRKLPHTIVTGRVKAAGDRNIIEVSSLTPAVYKRPRLKFDAMSGGNMGTSLGVIKEVGLFDEDPCLATAEDAEWSYRALRKGVAIVYAPELVVQHFGWRDQLERVDQYLGYARSHGGFYGKYIRQGDLFIFTRALLHHFRALRWWIRGKVMSDKELAHTGKAYTTGLLPGMVRGFRGGLKMDHEI